MVTPLALGAITIHPVVEQQGAFFNALSFFPNLTKEAGWRFGAGVVQRECHVQNRFGNVGRSRWRDHNL